MIHTAFSFSVARDMYMQNYTDHETGTHDDLQIHRVMVILNVFISNMIKWHRQALNFSQIQPIFCDS